MRSSGSASAAIDTFLQQHLLPVVPQLLVEEDPMPLYALKFLGGLLEVNARCAARWPAGHTLLP